MSKAPKKIETLEQDIRNLLTEVQKGQDPSKPNAWISPEALSSFGVQAAVSIDRQFHRVHKERKPNTIYASELGIKCPRKIWYKHNSTPADGLIKVYPPNVITKFMYGDLVEGMALLMVEAAGHKVSHRQHPVKMHFKYKGDEWEISGKIDAIIDDTALVDVKSTTSFGFKDFTSGTGGDKFGYREQLSYYLNYATTLPVNEAGYLAIDKGLGHIAYCPERTYTQSHVLDLAVSYAKTTAVADLESLAYMPTVEHSAGNFKLGTECSYCEYKHECWKGANGGKGIRSFAYAGKVVDLVVVSKEPKVPEITRELDTIDE